MTTSAKHKTSTDTAFPKINRTSAGFTLVELVVTIVILGTLSAFALPRLADLGDDADQAVFESVKGSFESSVALVRAKALASDAGGAISFGGNNVDLAPSGYPAVSQSASSCQSLLSWIFSEENQRIVARASLALIGISRAHAGGGGTGGGPGGGTGGGSSSCELPDLLLEGDLEGWTWTSSGTTGSLTSPDGRSIEYDQSDGSVNVP